MSRFSTSIKLCGFIAAFSALALGCGGVDAVDQHGLSEEDIAAGGVPSAKATAVFSDIAIMDAQELGWTDVLSTQLKTSNQKTLFINASLECGLLTKTTVRSKNGTKDTSTSTASVMLQVLVDGVAAAPGAVVYCRRTQELSATLGGILEKCTDANADGTILASECLFTPEEISLLLSTMNAASFNFGAEVGTGVHSITVQAKINTSTSTQTGEAVATGTIGKGSVVVTEQRLAGR
jgi:hypothetical protein